MTKIQIPYGSKQIELETEEEVLELEIREDRRSKSINPEAVIKQALRKPIGTKRLREIVATKKRGNIVIVVDDHTRTAPTEIMLDALTEEIGEVHNDKISLLVACGTHTPPTSDDLQRMLGKHLGRYSIKIHDCDAQDLVHVGTTTRGTPVMLNRNYVEADIRILTGDITLHYYAGFGGGRKSILPGISSREAIKRNHALLVDEHAKIANIDHNPVHLDMLEAASFAPPEFVLNAVVAENGSIVDAYAGDMGEVFLKGVDVAKDLFLHETPELFDILIVSAGGYPKDRDFYQATKAIENCYRAVVPGGDLILVAECQEGIGDIYFERWMNDYATYEDAEEAIKTNFVLGGHKAYYLRKVMARIGLAIVSELDTHDLARWGINAHNSVGDALEGIKKDNVKIGIVKKGLDTLIVPAIKS